MTVAQKKGIERELDLLRGNCKNENMEIWGNQVHIRCFGLLGLSY